MIAALLCALGLVQGELELPKRAPIAHLAGFETTSSVQFASAPERVHQLVATHVFPARMRWLLTVPGEPASARSIFYRSGARWFAHDAGSTASRELAGDERDGLEHLFTLRQALVLWPDGFEWTAGGGERVATIGASARLVATLGPDARPASIAWRDAANVELEALRAIAWRDAGQRKVPRSFELCLRGERVWNETLSSVSFEVAYLDDFFVPLDRRPRAAPETRAATEERVEIPARWVKKLEVALDAPGDDAEKLIARVLGAREAIAKDAALASKLAPGVELELDGAGRPAAAWLRLADEVAPPDESWLRRAGASALSLRFDPARLALSAALAALLERVPTGARARPAYVRLAGGPSGTGAQIVVPLEPAN
jgi:hypothetical protein